MYLGFITLKLLLTGMFLFIGGCNPARDLNWNALEADPDFSEDEVILSFFSLQ